MRKSFLILASIFLVFAASATAGAVIPITSTHYVDGVQVTNGQNVSTNNPFEYSIVLQNNTDVNQCLELQEIISNQLDLESATITSHGTTHSITPDVEGMGLYNDYKFHNICLPIPNGSSGTATITMTFKNNHTENQETASIFVRYKNNDGSCISDFELFVFNALVPAIPEFPTVAIPAVAVIGLAFVFTRKK